MIAETKRHPAELKDAVASPGGTTIAAIATLEQNGFRGALVQAVAAAAKRSRELGGNERTGCGSSVVERLDTHHSDITQTC